MEGDLGYTPAVPEVYEDEPPVVAAPADSARKLRALADVLRTQFACRGRPVGVSVRDCALDVHFLLTGRIFPVQDLPPPL